MGVEYEAQVMIGIWFDSPDEAIEWVVSNNIGGGSVGDLDDILLYTDLHWEVYSCYFDQGGCIGIHVEEEDFDPTGHKIFQIYQKLWKIIPQESHKDVQAHIWAGSH